MHGMRREQLHLNCVSITLPAVSWGVNMQASGPNLTCGLFVSLFVCFCFLFSSRLYVFRGVLGAQQNWGEGAAFSYMPSAPHMYGSPIIKFSQQTNMFVLIDELTLTHHKHPKWPVFFIARKLRLVFTFLNSCTNKQTRICERHHI